MLDRFDQVPKPVATAGVGPLIGPCIILTLIFGLMPEFSSPLRPVAVLIAGEAPGIVAPGIGAPVIGPPGIGAPGIVIPGGI